MWTSYSNYSVSNPIPLQFMRTSSSFLLQDKVRVYAGAGAGKRVLDHRWSSGVLYGSSDEDGTTDDSEDGGSEGGSGSGGDCTRRVSGVARLRGQSSHENLFSNFTVGSADPTRVSLNRAQHHHEVGGSSRRRFNPLGQMEVQRSALLPEDDVADAIDEVSGCPVVDDWLVDDLGGSPPAKRRRQRDASVERESRALLGLAGGSTRRSGARISRPKAALTRPKAAPVRPIGSRDVRPKPSTSRSPVSERGCPESSVLGPSTMRGGGSIRGGEAGGVNGGRARRRKGVVAPSSGHAPQIVISSSDSDTEEDYETWKRKSTMAAGYCSSTSLSRVHPSASHHLPSASSPTPLRVKVRIENSTYLIPCPAKVGNGHTDTPVSWLVAQASERYFSQRGKRPELELTTMDGASLFQADPIAHVLGQDQEVMGVVKKWVCPPLVERYRVACKVAGVGMWYVVVVVGGMLNLEAHCL